MLEIKNNTKTYLRMKSLNNMLKITEEMLKKRNILKKLK